MGKLICTACEHVNDADFGVKAKPCEGCGEIATTRFNQSRSELRQVGVARMEAEGDKLRERGSTLRSRRRQKFSTAEFHHLVTDDDTSGCALAHDGGCWGGIQAHHYVPQQRIKRAGLSEKNLDFALTDPRNGVPLCHFHHAYRAGAVGGMSEVRYCANLDCVDGDGRRTVIDQERVRARPNIKHCCAACKTQVWRQGRDDAPEGRRDGTGDGMRRRTGGPRGADMPWRRSVSVAADGLLALDRLPETAAEAAEVAERLLAPALNARQAARVGLTPMAIAGREAPPGDDELAKRIARAHNALRAVADGGVLAFSEQGRALWPLADGNQYGLPIDRLPFPVRDQDVTAGDVAAWLAEHREWQAAAFEQRERERAEAHARGEIRRGEQERHYGMVRGAANCTSCGALKSRPSAVCTLCGDEPSADTRAYDIACGYAA